MANAKILPPNDPRRPDWAILGRLTRQEQIYRDGLTVEEASELMRQSLVDAWLARPEEVLVACASQKLAARSKEYASTPSRAHQMMEFLKERMWMTTEDGQTPPMRGSTGISSAAAILYWRPAESGVVSYIKARVNWLLVDFDKALVEQGKSVSLEGLHEKGADLASTGEFVRRAKHEMPADDVDPTERHLDGGDLYEQRAALMQQRQGELLPSGAESVTHSPADEEAAIHATAKRDRLASLSAPQKADVDLESPTRNEYAFFSNALDQFIDPAPSPEDRAIQIRRIALQCFDKHCADIEAATDIRKEIEEWDAAKKSFFQQFPDVAEQVIEKVTSPHLSAKVDGPQAKPDAPTVSKDAEIASQLLGYSGIETSPEDLDRRASPIEERARAEKALRLVSMWGEKSNPEFLESPDRPDYQFLCEQLDIDPNPELTPKELHGTLRGLAVQWLQTVPRGDVLPPASLKKAIEHWDPSSGFLNEIIMEELVTIAGLEVRKPTVSAASSLQREAGLSDAELAELIFDDAREQKNRGKEITPAQKEASPGGADIS